MKHSNAPLIIISKLPGKAFPYQSTRTVLLALADFASAKNGFTAWPSRRTLAERTGLSRATITRAFRDLKNMGLIEIEARYRENMQTSNLFRLSITAINALAATVGRGLTAITRGAHHVTQKFQKKVKNTFQPTINSPSSRKTRDIPLEEQLLDTSWAD